MKPFLQKLNRIFHRKPKQRGLFGTPPLSATRETKKQPVEPQNVVPYFCVTMLLRMKAEQREREIAARRDEKAEDSK